jgi:hypothetical protein
MNPYGALSQMYHNQIVKAQRKKLMEYTSCMLFAIFRF